MHENYPELQAELKALGLETSSPLTMPLDAARAAQERYFGGVSAPLPDVASSRDVVLPGPHGPFSCRITHPAPGRLRPVVVFVRGGGWWAGSLDSHNRTARSIAAETGCAVCAIDYHRTPEAHFPVQRDELLFTLQWLHEHGDEFGADAGRLALFGESAGATLSLTAAQWLRDQRQVLPSGLVLFYPNAAGPLDMKRPYSQWVWQQYLGPQTSAQDPAAVPVLAPLHGLPPVWLGVGGDDPLTIDAEAVHAGVLKAGGRSTLITYPGLPHGFVILAGRLKPARRALDDALAAIRGFKGFIDIT